VRLAVSNSGPLIHLAKAGLLHLIKLYDVVIPQEVKHEVVDVGKAKGYSDAFFIEKAVKEGWIKIIRVNVDEKFSEIARLAGLHEAEIATLTKIKLPLCWMKIPREFLREAWVLKLRVL